MPGEKTIRDKKKRKKRAVRNTGLHLQCYAYKCESRTVE